MSEAAATNPPSAVVLIGLGNMGTPMATRLHRVGFSVTGVDLSEEARRRFAATGANVDSNAAAAARQADVVITLLPDGKAVRSALDPLRSSLKPGCIVIDMSSSDPIGTRDLGGTFLAAGFDFIDAPVSGGVKRAIDGTLAIMAGGAASSIDRVSPLLSVMGKSIFRTGVLGSGHAMKALNNYVSAAGLVAAVEATQVGMKFGLDPDLMADILNASTGRNNTTEVKLKQFINSRTFNAGFPLRLMAKDVRTAASLARAVGAPAPLAGICAKLWDDASQALDVNADHTEIGRHIETLKS
jgi:3-hydroxyisobutyrate dehydrogenase